MATIQALSCLEAKPCQELDVLLKAVCKCWDAPNACITLVGSHQVWLCNPCSTSTDKSMQCVSWSVAMCPWTLLTPHPMAMAIDDLDKDARFSGNLHHKVCGWEVGKDRRHARVCWGA